MKAFLLALLLMAAVVADDKQTLIRKEKEKVEQMDEATFKALAQKQAEATKKAAEKLKARAPKECTAEQKTEVKKHSCLLIEKAKWGPNPLEVVEVLSCMSLHGYAMAHFFMITAKVTYAGKEAKEDIVLKKTGSKWSLVTDDPKVFAEFVKVEGNSGVKDGNQKQEGFELPEEEKWVAGQAKTRPEPQGESFSFRAVARRAMRRGSTSPSSANCRIYLDKAAQGKLKLSNKWRTYTYSVNAYCACRNTPNSYRANKVRWHLQDTLKRDIAGGKSLWTTDDIYRAHVRAYRYAGCPCGPADKWAWHGVTNVPLKFDETSPLNELLTPDAISCTVVQASIAVMGSCNGCYVGCCPARRICRWGYCVTVCPCHEFCKPCAGF